MSAQSQIVKALLGGIFLSNVLFQNYFFLQYDSFLYLKCCPLFLPRVILWQYSCHFCFFCCISHWLKTKYENPNVKYFFLIYSQFDRELAAWPLFELRQQQKTFAVIWCLVFGILLPNNFVDLMCEKML